MGYVVDMPELEEVDAVPTQMFGMTIHTILPIIFFSYKPL
jgi:hypothetical protein